MSEEEFVLIASCEKVDKPIMRILMAWFCVVLLTTIASAADKDAIPKDALVVVVTDPLSKEIACDCVAGYAQRDYTKLGSYLQAAIKKPVVVVFSESMTVAIKDKSQGRADIIIGKDSVVRADAKSLGLSELEPAVALTDKQGVTSMRGLFVVKKECTAASLLDIENYQILFGPQKCDEKWMAPRATLKKLDIPYTDASKPCETCSVAAKELAALPSDTKSAAVISSYALALLEGCGTVKKGDLRVIGETDTVPFITCFVSRALPNAQRQSVREALLALKDPALLTALESKSGFVPY